MFAGMQSVFYNVIIAINPVFVSILASGLCLIAISLANKEKENEINKQNASNNRGRSEVIK